MGKPVAERQPLTLELDKLYPVVGLSEKPVGYVSRISVDLEFGVVVSCEIQTDWQRMNLEWDCLEFSAAHDLFHIRKALK